MVVDMFALGKLNYRINEHEKDIFNFCFISIVNRVLQIVSILVRNLYLPQSLSLSPNGVLF